MKTIALMMILSLGQASSIALARHTQTLTPKAPLKITCTQADGSIETVNVVTLYVNPAEGRATGMHFGYNRGDEGFYELKGTCVVEANAPIQIK